MEKAFSRMLLVLKQCEGGIESGARTHDNRGIIYLSEFGHTFLMHLKETIYRAEQAQQGEPRCGCGDGFTSDAMCANCLAAKPPAVAVPGAVDLLREMEWENNRFADACPVCASSREQGHAADCKLAAVLAAAQKGGS